MTRHSGDLESVRRQLRREIAPGTEGRPSIRCATKAVLWVSALVLVVALVLGAVYLAPRVLRSRRDESSQPYHYREIVWSPNGRLLAIGTDRPSHGILVIDRKSGRRHFLPVQPPPGGDGPIWLSFSADNRTLLYSVWPSLERMIDAMGEPGLRGSNRVQAIDARSGKIALNVEGVVGAWAPKGDRLYYSRYSSGPGGQGLYLASLKTPNDRGTRVSTHGPSYQLIYPSPNGRYCVFTAEAAYLADLQTHTMKVLWTTQSPMFVPIRWSRDSSRFVYLDSSFGWPGKIYEVRPDAPNPTKIGEVGYDVSGFSAQFSPDLRVVAYVMEGARPARVRSLCLVTVGQTGSRAVAKGKGVHHFTWSPSGDEIAGIRRRGSREEVWIYTGDGRSGKKLCDLGPATK